MPGADFLLFFIATSLTQENIRVWFFTRFYFSGCTVHIFEFLHQHATSIPTLRNPLNTREGGMF
jgi:hypothetical protein